MSDDPTAETTNIGDAIAGWSSTRPDWQQYVLKKLVTGEVIDHLAIEKLLADIKVGNPPSPTSPVTASDFSGVAASGTAISLASIGAVTNINALSSDRALDFCDAGVTLVYGDNGSGKSGYARLIKDAVGARHEEQVRPNAFNAVAGERQSAEISYRADHLSAECVWPDAIASDLRSIMFYDAACGGEYVSKAAALSYRPSALYVMDGLIAVCTSLRDLLDREIGANADSRNSLPATDVGTSARRFLDNLGSETSEAHLDDASEVPINVEAQIADLNAGIVRLEASNPAKEQTRLNELATEIESVAKHIGGIDLLFNDHAVERLNAAVNESRRLRAVAKAASSSSFDGDPLSGVGSDSWRSLWLAATRFSHEEAYSGQEFPYVGDESTCVLCQQALSEDAKGRFARFKSFMEDSTEQDAVAAEAVSSKLLLSMNLIALSTPDITASLAEIHGSDPVMANSVTGWLKTSGARRDTIAAKFGELPDTQVPALEPPPKTTLDDKAADLRVKALVINATKFQEELTSKTNSRNDLRGRAVIRDHRATLLKEVGRLKSLAALEEIKRQTDTALITRKSGEIEASFVTAEVNAQFIVESERLGLEGVRLNKTGTAGGKAHHQPALLGVVTATKVVDVLSEGEQTALGLAGYFTEAHFDGSKSALVLDDPMTSLDHVRRSRVATRLAEFALERQVVVFTHDAAFVTDIQKSAASVDVQVTERSIQRRGNQPGLCLEKMPWKVSDVGTRMNELRMGLAELKRDRQQWTDEEYEEKCSGWAGKLSETWERIIHLEVVYPIVVPGSGEVRLAMFKVISRVSKRDDAEFQSSYHKISGWARRHDNAPGTQFVAPEPDVLGQELAVVQSWFDRIKSYRNDKAYSKIPPSVTPEVVK